ncbi:response regulator transcription factor [Corynebacterium mastitidis]|uniref:response regulator transcription factor n=1 Tax=Corynebacterium mastitidis TaxID=161890 RepID=UPI00036B10C7|nr:response regulator transcription factor [Corynebacterium mastitidis]
MIRVAVVDDEALVAASLGTLLGLENDVEILATAGSGEEILRWWRRQDALGGPLPDVAVVDLHMKDLDGIATARALRALAPGLAVLIVTSHARPRGLRRALENGVRGFLPKTATAQQFSAAIRALHAGERSIDPELAAWTIATGDCPLTERETEVIEAAGRGGSVTDIAEEVRLAPGTTRNYLSSAMRKVGAGNRFEAYMIVRERGWL